MSASAGKSDNQPLFTVFKTADYSTGCYHCCLLAVAALVPTAVAGVLDWLHRFGGSMETLIVIKLVLAPVFLLVLLLALWQARAGASAGRMLVLYGLATLCAVGLGFSGGELVYGG